MLKVTGTIRVQPDKGRVVLQLSPDFTKYYIWHIQRYFKIRVSEPLHGGHVSLALPKFDKKVDWKTAKAYENVKVDIHYYPDIRVGGKTKNTFRNFIIDFESDDLKAICWDINAERTTNHFHITLANNKGMGYRDWWWEMIEL